MGESLKSDGCIVVSGINFFEGGPLTLIKDCLRYLDTSPIADRNRVIALISDKKYYQDLALTNIELVEFPSARKSYSFRLYYEYFYFKKFASINKVSFWLSLHDITPVLKNTRQAVYCHNPAPFYSTSLREFRMEPSLGFFSYFYKYLYRININSNKYVIVQQQWIRERFVEFFELDRKKIIVAHPRERTAIIRNVAGQNERKVFFYPTIARVFKNIELIGEAIKLLSKKGLDTFDIIVTVDGTESKYSQWIKEEYEMLPNLKLIGKQPLEEIYKLYARADFLIFPSKLETWGLPITEFKQTNKPVLLADLPYAHETLGDYNAACFFNPASSQDLADKIELALSPGTQIFHPHSFQGSIEKPMTTNWDELFKLLLGN